MGFRPQGLVTGGVLPLLTQNAFFVDSVNGNDANDGETALTAIRTLAELEHRWLGRTFAPSVTAVTITLIGTFPLEYLALDWAAFTAPATITILGQVTTVDSGTITVYTTWNGAAAGADGQRGVIEDAAQDFSPYLLTHRIRMTDGPANGGVTFSGSTGAGVAFANIGQFCSSTPATVNPANGNAYVIERFDTVCAGYSFHLAGPVSVVINGIRFTSVASPANRSGALVGEHETRCLFFGCLFDSTLSSIYEGRNRYAGCGFIGALGVFSYGAHSFLNSSFFGFTQFNQCHMLMQAIYCDGAGARNSTLFIGNGTYAEVIGGSGNFGVGNYGCINSASGPALIMVEDFAQVIFSNAASNLVGATGNTTVQGAIGIKNGTGVVYVTKGKATGAAPGVTDVTLAGVGVAWGAGVPAIAAPPGNAFINTRV